ncbi:hypothetical protein LC613_42450 [Nostoc sphaeroides CHAB 2801]|uniref:hypothetical protein n=1 Tax=Nostoc sphaeroides TaxID=446679 RepID=UPI0015F310FC|nr:hypothetical protein [Nostoc sphaeroides]MCC5634070.1 hypothetical protein [Nostoc sphaeroides CHAB 2801]
MTDTPFPNRLDRIEQIILGVAERQANTQAQLDVANCKHKRFKPQTRRLSLEG